MTKRAGRILFRKPLATPATLKVFRGQQKHPMAKRAGPIRETLNFKLVDMFCEGKKTIANPLWLCEGGAKQFLSWKALAKL